MCGSQGAAEPLEGTGPSPTKERHPATLLTIAEVRKRDTEMTKMHPLSPPGPTTKGGVAMKSSIRVTWM